MELTRTHLKELIMIQLDSYKQTINFCKSHKINLDYYIKQTAPDLNLILSKEPLVVIGYVKYLPEYQLVYRDFGEDVLKIVHKKWTVEECITNIWNNLSKEE